MKIGFDAKRAFLNNTGLGNYSRDTIQLLTENNPEITFFLLGSIAYAKSTKLKEGVFGTQISPPTEFFKDQ